VAIVEGARRCGIGSAIELERIDEAPFDPVRSFHAAVVGGTPAASDSFGPRQSRRMCVKGLSAPLEIRTIVLLKIG